AERFDIIEQAVGMSFDEIEKAAECVDTATGLGVQPFLAALMVVAIGANEGRGAEQRLQQQGQFIAPLHQEQAVIVAAADLGFVVQVHAMGHGALPCDTAKARSLAGAPPRGCALCQRLSMARMLARASLPRAALTSTGASS